jgi:hypothetical protein
LSKSKDKDSRVERYAPNCRGLSVGANFGLDFACRLGANHSPAAVVSRLRDRPKATNLRSSSSAGRTTLQRREMTVKPTSKWRSLSERVVNLKDGENIVLEREGDLTKEARNIHDGLNGIRACDLVGRTVKVVGGKIVITRVGTRRTLGVFSGFKAR